MVDNILTQEATVTTNEQVSTPTSVDVKPEGSAPLPAAAVETSSVQASPTPVQTTLADLLAEELRADKSLESFKDVNALAKSYISAQKMLGSSIRIPTQDASKEAVEEFLNKVAEVQGVMRTPDTTDPKAMQDFYNKMGRPATPENYRLDVNPEDVAKLKLETDLASYKKMAYEMGLTNDQANALAKVRVQERLADIEAQTKSLSAAESTLKSKWGTEYNNYITSAKLAVDYIGEQFPGAKEELLTSSASNNPIIVSMLAEYGKQLHEKGALKTGLGVKFGTSREDAIARLEDMASNPNHIIRSKYDSPERQQALLERERLARIADSNG